MLLRLVTPRDPAGMRKLRVGNPGRDGRNGDGGYVMADDFDDVAAALSIGIGGEVSWDLDVAGRGIAVHQFDHTVERSPVAHPLFRFNRVGVAATDSADGTLRSLDGIVAGLGAAGDLLLQMDCEGAEWDALKSASSKTLRRFSQIVVEIHDPLCLTGGLKRGRFAKRVRSLLTLHRLARTHQLVHAHANSCGRVETVGGVAVPVVIELSYLRRDRARFVPAAAPLPGPLDVSNGARPDVPIGALLAQR